MMYIMICIGKVKQNETKIHTNKNIYVYIDNIYLIAQYGYWLLLLLQEVMNGFSCGWSMILIEMQMM